MKCVLAIAVLVAGCAAQKDVRDAAPPRRVVLAIAEPEYHTWETLPVFAAQALHGQFGFEIVEVGEDPVSPGRLSGFVEALADADLLILSVRRRPLHPDEMAALKAYLAAGKPVVALRTSSHAFALRDNAPPPPGYELWPDFGAEVIGCNYTGHHGVGPKTAVTTAKGAATHTILRGVMTPFTSNASLYTVRPLKPGATPLLIGTIEGQEPEPIAWSYSYGPSRIFYTSLGHKDDFQEPGFVKLLENAALWAMEKD